jgi:hypothetical protein
MGCEQPERRLASDPEKETQMTSQSPAPSIVVIPADLPTRMLAELPEAEYPDGDIRRIGVAYDGSPEADVTLRAAESLASDLSAALTVYCRLGSAPTAPVGTATRTYRPETQLLLGVPTDEIAGRAYGVVDLLFVHPALLNDGSGALERAAGCPVIVS